MRAALMLALVMACLTIVTVANARSYPHVGGYKMTTYQLNRLQ